MKKKYERYESMRIDELKQEIYKLRYDLATSTNKRELKHIEKRFDVVREIIAKKMAEEKIKEMEDNPESLDEEIRRRGR